MFVDQLKWLGIYPLAPKQHLVQGPPKRYQRPWTQAQPDASNILLLCGKPLVFVCCSAAVETNAPAAHLLCFHIFRDASHTAQCVRLSSVRQDRRSAIFSSVPRT